MNKLQNVSRILLQTDGLLKFLSKTLHISCIFSDLQINVHREIGVPLAFKWHINLDNQLRYVGEKNFYARG